MDDLTVEARFAEQVAGDFPAETIRLPGGVEWTRFPRRTWRARLSLRVRWFAQGRPKHRGVVLTVGACWQDLTGGWHWDGWAFDGTHCPGIPAVDVETVADRIVTRAICGWHLSDLAAVATRGRVRRRWIW